jgi:hypothetical protein
MRAERERSEGGRGGRERERGVMEGLVSGVRAPEHQNRTQVALRQSERPY